MPSMYCVLRSLLCLIQGITHLNAVNTREREKEVLIHFLFWVNYETGSKLFIFLNFMLIFEIELPKSLLSSSLYHCENYTPIKIIQVIYFRQ